MHNFIQQRSIFLIKILIFCMFISCNEQSDETSQSKNKYKSYSKGEITLDTGEKLIVYIAKNAEQQQMGLSHIKSSQFKNNETMLFMDNRNSLRQFWMPDTHFNLDIIFLNEDLYVLDIHRNLQHFPKSGPKKLIPLSKKVFCQHILEIKSDSPLAKKIRPGMMLNWTATKNLLKIK